MKVLTTSRVTTVMLTLVAIAAVNRAGFGELLNGRDKFLGIF